MINANDILFRCSSLGHLMVEPKSKSEKLSETTKTHLIDVYTAEVYGRFEEIIGKALEKGNDTEEDSITIVSRVTKIGFKKNEQHLSNAYIKGTPDLFTGPEIKKAETIRDTKSSWSLFSFQRSINKELDKKYYWQLQGYAGLTGAKELYVDFCLNNTPLNLVQWELYQQARKQKDGKLPRWAELQVVANHVYDLSTFHDYINQLDLYPDDKNAQAIVDGFIEIPFTKRHKAFEFERNDADLERLYQRIEDCREWMNENLFRVKPELKQIA